MVTNTRPPPRMIDISTLSEPGRYLVLEANTRVLVRETSPSKCPGCGARDWIEHAGREVCSYCRTTRAGQPPRKREPSGPIPPPPAPPPTRWVRG